MSKQAVAKVFSVLMIVLMTYSDSFADIRIRFARGRTSATMSGNIRDHGKVCYVAGARSGQTLNATLSSKNGRVSFESNGETSYSEYLERSGDQSFCISNGSKTTSYTLTVSIQ